MRPSVLPQSKTSSWHVQQAFTASIRIKLTAVLRITSPQKQRGFEKNEYYSIIAAFAKAVNG